jgi:hypothetical protein
MLICPPLQLFFRLNEMDELVGATAESNTAEAQAHTQAYLMQLQVWTLD